MAKSIYMIFIIYKLVYIKCILINIIEITMQFVYFSIKNGIWLK